MFGQSGLELQAERRVAIGLEFWSDPGVNITVIVYGEFENLLQIDRNKAVLYDIYQR